MKLSQRPKYERRNERAAVLVMILLCIPILFIYLSFFSQAFFLDATGEFTLSNFQFLYAPVQMGQYTADPIGEAFGNTVIFTAVATTLEVTISCMAGYALARMEFAGKRLISFSLFSLRLFPGVLLLIGVLYVLLHIGILIYVYLLCWWRWRCGCRAPPSSSATSSPPSPRTSRTRPWWTAATG